MANIATIVAGLRVCPDVVTPMADRQMLEITIRDLVGIPDADRLKGTNLLWIAFDQMGIQSFLGDLITLTEDDIMNLTVRPTRGGAHPEPIPIMHKRRTVIVVATCHHFSRLRGASLDMRTFPVRLYDYFRISHYRHDETIVPWQVELPSQVNAKASFLRSVKPNPKEYKVLRDDKSWLPFKESLETTVMSHNLLTMIVPPFETDPNTGEFVIDPANGELIPYEPDDQGLDELQRTWFFKVLVDVCQTSVAKKIVNQKRDTVDTRQVWHELCEHYQNSISSKMQSQELLRWAHTAQLSNSNHRGAYQSWITNYTETIRQCQALQTDENKLSDQMCVDFLNNSMRGTTHLEGALDTCYTARKAAGIPDPFNITFEEHVERLIQAAQPYDAAIGQSRGRSSRSANFHSILGDESDEEEDSDDKEDPRASLEAFQSDWDRRSKSGGRKERKKDNKFYKKPGTPTKQRAMIPRTRWNTLDREDQMAWSKISESAKKMILGTSDNEKGRDSNPIVVVNNHEMVFEDEEVDEDNVVNPSISAQTHTSSNWNIVASVFQSDPARRTIQANTSTLRNSEESKYQDPEERGLLYMATHKMTKSNRQIDVNNAFSKAVEKKSSSHVTWDNDIEQPTNQRSKKTQLRVNMASRKKVVFRDDGTIVETPDDEEQDTSSQGLATPHTTASTRSRTYAATRGNRGRPRPTMTVARGRGRGHTPGSHYFGAGGQGGRNFQAPAPDGRTHLIPRSMRNTPPQQTVSEQHVPGVRILPVTQQALLNRCMAATNLTMSYVARSRHQLPTDNTSNSQQNWLNIGDIPNHTGVREDGTLIN